ncbi:MAG: FHA domain-containing protein [Myxococcales bacterium]|nr:FHA domain-containing protein [Myxococcales bacterium]
MTETLVCGSCGASVPSSHRFCGQCGSPMQGTQPRTAMQTAFFGAIQSDARARLVLIRGEGLDGVTFQLTGRHVAGRSTGSILFPDDGYLSPRHAEFFFEDERLYVQDASSLNGVFVRLRAPALLADGEVFLAGEELLRVQFGGLAGPAITGEDGHFFASPMPAVQSRITQVLEGGRPGLTVVAHAGSLVIGRERADLEFPNDRFISGRHCRVDFSPAGATVTDLGSRNGTFVRIRERQALADGDHIFLGRQLLRVELSA